ncbi:MAG: hypothetical protein H6937_02230 [Burkholderiales bacterium]|nr:hypothetical protein [Burkholderiales bacterium]
MKDIFAGLLPFIVSPGIEPYAGKASYTYTARHPHPRKNGTGRSSMMKRKNNPAGAKFAKAFAAGVATYRGKFRHFPK